MKGKQGATPAALKGLFGGQEEMLLFLGDRRPDPPPGDVCRLITALEERGLVHRVDEDHGRYRPTDLGRQAIDHLTDRQG